ncbi:MAG TPA: MBL fold metallo-hydrolase [Longimicrobiales bacterium]
MMSLDVRAFTSPEMGENAYLVRAEGSETAVVIDPGVADPVIATLRAGGLELEAVLLTHAHVDHIMGVAALVRETGVPVYLHPEGRALYDRAIDQAAMFGLGIEPPPSPDRALAHGEALRLAGCDFEVRHAPGHAPGHVVLAVRGAGVAFVGDVIFQGSIGRTDLPGGDFRRLMRSIREQVLTLPDETILYPGHGPSTTVGHERVSNPFLVPDYPGGFA